MNYIAAQTTTVKEKEGAMSKSHLFIMILLIITIVVLSFTVFSKESLRLDEAQSLWQTSHSALGMIQIVAQDVHVPLYHMMLHFWQVFFGNSVATARVLSLIFFVLSIPSMYMLGSYVYNRNVALFASVLMTISPFLNWYGNEIRMYSLFILLTILNMYFFTRIFLRPKVIKNELVEETALKTSANTDVTETGRGSIWIGYTVTALLGMFTHYFFAFNIIAQVFFFITHRRIFPKQALRSFAIVAIFLGIIYAPWIYYVFTLGAATNMQPLLSKPTTIDVFNTFSQFIFGFQDDHINTILVSLWPILVLLIFLSLRQNHRISPPTAYLFFSLFLPIFIAFVISNTVKPIYLSRYLILTLPSLYLLISWILYIYPPRLSRALRLVVVIGMAVTLMVEIVNANTPVKENYREASEYLSRYAAAQDVIAVSAPFTVYPLEYYYRGPAEIETIPLWNRLQYGSIPNFDESKLSAEVDQIKDNHEVLWLLLSYNQGYEEKIRLYFDTHFEKLVSVNFSPELNLYAYRLRYDSNFKPNFPEPATSTPAFEIDWKAPFDLIQKQLRGL
jgi:mannosyltransferase